MLFKVDNFKRKIDIKLFGPLNETDLGLPEGPLVSPEEYCKVIELLDKKLTDAGLNELKLVCPEQSRVNSDYVKEIYKYKHLAKRIVHLAMHSYSSVEDSVYEENFSS